MPFRRSWPAHYRPTFKRWELKIRSLQFGDFFFKKKVLCEILPDFMKDKSIKISLLPSKRKKKKTKFPTKFISTDAAIFGKLSKFCR